VNNLEENTKSSSNGKMPAIIVAVVVVVALIAIFGFMNHSKSQTQSSAAAPASQDAMTANTQPTSSDVMGASAAPSASGSATSADAQTIDVEAGSFYFKPSTITVKKGQKVTINLHAVSMMHDFNIDELNVHAPLTHNGESNTVEFTADKVGTFQYYCSVGQHRKLGQVGTITVTE
jgi:plastocyanin